MKMRSNKDIDRDSEIAGWMVIAFIIFIVLTMLNENNSNCDEVGEYKHCYHVHQYLTAKEKQRRIDIQLKYNEKTGEYSASQALPKCSTGEYKLENISFKGKDICGTSYVWVRNWRYSLSK